MTGYGVAPRSGAIGIVDLALGAVAFSVIDVAVHAAIDVAGADHTIQVVVAHAMGLAIEVGVADSIAVGVVSVGFGLTHGQGSTHGATQCVVGPARGAAFGIGLGELTL